MTDKPKVHPITDAVLLVQREAMKKHTSAGTPIAEQRRVSRELLWHAMHTLAMLDPHVDMKAIAELSKDAIKSGVELGEAMGNHRL